MKKCVFYFAEKTKQTCGQSNTLTFQLSLNMLLLQNHLLRQSWLTTQPTQGAYLTGSSSLPSILSSGLNFDCGNIICF